MPVKPVFDPVSYRLAWGLMWRTLLVGTALFVVPPTAMPPTVGQQATVLHGSAGAHSNPTFA